MLREDLVRILAERDLFRRQLDERPTREEYVALAEACESWSVRAKKAEAMLEAIRAAVGYPRIYDIDRSIAVK